MVSTILKYDAAAGLPPRAAQSDVTANLGSFEASDIWLPNKAEKPVQKTHKKLEY